MSTGPPPKTVLWTALAMVAFAANSLLCRGALGGASIDAASFSSVRLVSGAVTLWGIGTWSRGRAPLAGSWRSATALFLYAVPFSFAYVTLATGTGALILFGAVQTTMMVAALRGGERPNALQWAGLLAAIVGLTYLVLPGLEAPSPLGSALMATAGIAWGVYSLFGRGTGDPLRDTGGNFARAVPMVLAVSLVFHDRLVISLAGALLAAASGALASGVGYAVWYTAIVGLSATQAAVVQLCVPVLAALGGIALLGEALTARLVISSVVILGGVGLALAGRGR